MQQGLLSQRTAAQAPVLPPLKPAAASRANAGYLAVCSRAIINLPKRRVRSQVCSGPGRKLHIMVC